MSRPKTRATTPTSTAAPAIRRMPSAAGRKRRKAVAMPRPNNSAAASAVTAPAANTRSRMDVPRFAPFSAALVSSNPRIGPAQGAHRRPVPTPKAMGAKTEGEPRLGSRPASRAPRATTGLLMRSPTAGTSSASPKTASNAIAAYRADSLSATTHAPPTAARLVTAAKATAMLANMGRVWERNERFPGAKTKGRTGRMHGLAMVSTPPRKATRRISMVVATGGESQEAGAERHYPCLRLRGPWT